ncbi:hypothetical protein DSOL_1171 [Desulfosporosinus metallidurans]|uniref:Uncharacterized protein n=1 Tax=Desulfosporosinus metallidurans TaxID=1888891 RepID=A0A1Q8R0Y1_9FIRM|nr:hypothetical protein DSOL_1171 [Desulfosporosinus metallidurans]
MHTVLRKTLGKLIPDTVHAVGGHNIRYADIHQPADIGVCIYHIRQDGDDSHIEHHLHGLEGNDEIIKLLLYTGNIHKEILAAYIIPDVLCDKKLQGKPADELLYHKLLPFHKVGQSAFPIT